MIKMEIKHVVADELAEIESRDDIVTKKIFVVPGCYTPKGIWEQATFYVLYEEAEEQLAKEKEELSKLDKVAQELEKDKVFMSNELKNATQRELYLLSRYDLPSTQAKKMIELVNMKRIVKKFTT